MKVRLLDPDRDNKLEPTLPPLIIALVEDDLELRTLYRAMSAGDDFLYEVAAKVIPLSLIDPVVIEYRQNVLADCMAHREVVDKMYAIASDAVQVHRKVLFGGLLFRDPEAILRSAVRILEYLVENLRQLRAVCDNDCAGFESDGFGQFVSMISEELSDDYLNLLDRELAELLLPRGVLLSAHLALGNKGVDHVLHRTPQRSWWDKITGNYHGPYGFEIDPRDQAGGEALNDLAGRAINDAANTVAQSSDHVKGFFERLRIELGFYRGCVNLSEKLAKSGIPTCFPTPTPLATCRMRALGLRDVGLCLTTGKPVVGNDINGHDKTLIMATGANEGGKSTFLRSVGNAQMLMQAGMFVTAESFEANVVRATFTHFKREEDDTMTSGKLDEELARMSTIADAMTPQSLLLCNESFASTNEREGSQIARGVIDACAAANVKVVFVTHLYDLAHSLYDRGDPTALFLRAERCDDGARTFRLIAAEPEPTSYGVDSFLRVFGSTAGLIENSR